MGLPKEGIQLANEALEILQRLGDIMDQVECSIKLASLLCDNGQLENLAFLDIHIGPRARQIHYALAGLSRNAGRPDNAHVHVERAKSHTANGVALRVADTFEELGAVGDLELCRRQLRQIQQKLDSSAASGQS